MKLFKILVIKIYIVDNISIKFKTFAPFIFKRLIYLDDLNETDLIKYCLINNLKIPFTNEKQINY